MFLIVLKKFVVNVLYILFFFFVSLSCIEIGVIYMFNWDMMCICLFYVIIILCLGCIEMVIIYSVGV